MTRAGRRGLAGLVALSTSLLSSLACQPRSQTPDRSPAVPPSPPAPATSSSAPTLTASPPPLAPQPSPTRSGPVAAFRPVAHYRPLWTQQLTDPGDRDPWFAVVGDAIVTRRARALTITDAISGRQRQHALPDDLDGYRVASGPTGQILLLDRRHSRVASVDHRSGEMRWRWQLPVYYSDLQVNDHRLLASDSGSLTAFDLTRRTRLWQTAFEHTPTILGFDDHRVHVEDIGLHALDLTTGAASPPPLTHCHRCNAILQHEQRAFSIEDNVLRGHRIGTDDIRWQRQRVSGYELLLADDALFLHAPGDAGYLVALHPDTGAELWSWGFISIARVALVPHRSAQAPFLAVLRRDGRLTLFGRARTPVPATALSVRGVADMTCEYWPASACRSALGLFRLQVGGQVVDIGRGRRFRADFAARGDVYIGVAPDHRSSLDLEPVPVPIPESASGRAIVRVGRIRLQHDCEELDCGKP